MSEILARVLGIEWPIVQAPMAGTQGSALAIAVSEAGGLGSLPCAMLTTATARDEIRAIQAGTKRPFNVNFFCHRVPSFDDARERRWRERLAPYYRELGVEFGPVSTTPGPVPFDADAAALLAELRPPIVSFHFGLPAADLLSRVRATGAKILASATTIVEGRWLEEHGVDAIIAQGFEAGGHRGMFLVDDLTTQIGTLALVAQLVSAVRVPVIAAGGIADARGVTAALTLGALAAQVGTAYLLCPEATTSAVHRHALQSDAADHTAVTNVFTGRPARAIVNRLVREVGPMALDAPAFPLALDAVLPLRAAAERVGSADFSPLWAGQYVRRGRAVAAGALTRELAGVGSG